MSTVNRTHFNRRGLPLCGTSERALPLKLHRVIDAVNCRMCRQKWESWKRRGVPLPCPECLREDGAHEAECSRGDT